MSTEAEELSTILLELTKKRVEPVKIVKAPEVSTESSIESDNLSEIIKTRDKIEQVKQNLSIIIDSIADNPSLVTRASNAWGEWATWQKVGTGLVLTVPAVLVGAAASVASLLILGGATGVVYTTTGMILEDHHACNVNIKQRLKDGILSIASVLELTIVALDNIRLRLAEEIGKFKAENLKLSTQVSILQDQISTLTIEIGILVETEAFLRITKEGLQKQALELKKTTDLQSTLLQKNQEELVAITRDYQITQKNLSTKVEELRAVREAMSAEVTKTQNISVSLQKAVTTLSGQVLEERAQKQAFQSKLELLLTDKEESASKLMERMITTHKELKGAKEDLCANNLRNRELLAKQEELMRRLEKLDLSLVQRREDETRPSVGGRSTLFSALLVPSGSLTSVAPVRTL